MLPKMDVWTMIGALGAGRAGADPDSLGAGTGPTTGVKGLRAGGDDYLTKPYAFSELLARVEVLGRRKAPQAAETSYQVADLKLDRLSHRVTAGRRGTFPCSRASSACSNI